MMHRGLGISGFIILSSIISIFFLGGCVTTPGKEAAWNLATQVHSPKAYEDFIKRYPDSLEAKEAKKRLEESKEFFAKSRWAELEKADSVRAYIDFVLSNPTSPRVNEIPDLAYNLAIESSSPRELYLFLTHFPSHSGVQGVSQHLEDLEFEKAMKNVNPLRMDLFLKKYPSSRYASKALLSLEDKSFKEAQLLNSVLGYKAYLNRFPQGRYAPQVRSKLQAVKSKESPTYTREDYQRLLGEVRKIPGIEEYGCALIVAKKILENGGSENVGIYALRYQLGSIFEELNRGWLGVFIQDVTEDLAKSFGLPGTKGALARDVTPDSPAERAGMQRGDVIMEYEGKEVKGVNHLINTIAQTEPGEVVNINVLRKGTTKGLTVTIGEQPAGLFAAAGPGAEPSKDLMIAYGFDPVGMKIGWDSEGWPVIEAVSPGSPAQKSGLKAGDRILKINDKSMQNAGWLEYALAISGTPGEPVNLSIESQGKPLSYEIKRQTASIARAKEAERTLPYLCTAVPDSPIVVSDEKAFSEAASMLLEFQKEWLYLAQQGNIYEQKNALIQESITAATKLTDDIEADELAREVLESTEYEPQVSEKGSETAKKAMRRLEYLKDITSKNLQEANKLLSEGLFRHAMAAQEYVMSFIQYSPGLMD
jgi:outer membrane protein assembly factor BamD (BamD/ComL family)